MLTHLTHNTESGARLLGWARTGVPSYKYQRVEARAAASREQDAWLQALITDVRRSADEFSAAAAAIPARAWRPTIRWTTGHETHAALVVPSRLGEVLIHHVDLDTGYRPADWPAAFVADFFNHAITGLRAHRDTVGSVRIETADIGRIFVMGETASASPVIAGTECALLAWLLGRSDGRELSHDGRLPDVPAFYAV